MGLKCKHCGSTRILATEEKVMEITGPFRIYGPKLQEILAKKPRLHRKPAPEGVIEGRVAVRPSETKSFRDGLFQCECGRKGHIDTEFEVIDECPYCGEPITGMVVVCTYSQMLRCDRCMDRYDCFHNCDNSTCPLKQFFMEREQPKKSAYRRVSL
jgi:hypothetical protein